jgi:hypothetical protein
MKWFLWAAIALAAAAPAFAQDGAAPPSLIPGLHRPLDELLDIYVRDGFVYYNALRSDRAKLDQYVRALDGPSAVEQAKGSREEKIAFWINAYNAFVLQTVINHFPIRGRAPDYPATSIRQIPGAFDRQVFRAAGQSLTLDAIEKDMLTPLGEPRAFLALGRGAVGSGRLRSEAYDPKRLDAQLEQVAAESLSRREIIRLDILNNLLSVTPIFSWREPAFVAAFEKKASDVFNQRSAIERAVLGLIRPYLKPSEIVYIEKNAFRISFHPFDWRLNDLSNRPPDGEN